jgi:dipeptidyl aminopeptidase/acylaminoacyl peptidase
MAYRFGRFSGGVVALAAFSGVALAQTPLTLEKIMADPDWMGPAVREAYWAVDGKSAYYSLKRSGSPVSDMHRITLSDGKDSIVEGASLGNADGPAVFDKVGKHAAFIRNGDVFVRDAGGGKLQQITRGAHAGALQFSADGKLLSFRTNDEWCVHDFAADLTYQAAQLKTEKDPDRTPDFDDLREFQMRTFSTLRHLREDKDTLRRHDEELRKIDGSRPGLPFYLGDEVVVRATALSPDAKWMLVITAPKPSDSAHQGWLTHYVTESGFEESANVRARVGRKSAAPQSLLLLNLADHSVHPLKTNSLPGIGDDPLQSIRAENAAKKVVQNAASSDAKPKTRGVWVVDEDPDLSVAGMVWSDDSKQLAVEIFAIDNKDRWIASVDFEHYALSSQHRLSDAAWVNTGPFNDVGWLHDSRTLWYESEESGFAQLYVKKPNENATALTHGRFEVSSPKLSADGRFFYLLANREAPGSYDVYRVSSGGGELQRLTQLSGVERYMLQQGGKDMLLTHSSAYLRPQLAVASADGSGKVRELTDTRSSEYKGISWVEPEIVQVPSTHFNGVVYGKLYRDPKADPAQKHPAVLFVHGAGYLQDVSKRYSYYFREQMFNNLLVQHGYVVLDLDYRASMGYGRDWRTAIYRQMGTPELEDMLDGKKWLVEKQGADPKRFGVYGGSYGGFMTLMALFRSPGEFAAGAALRPVTDWMQYDQNYTSQILNEPQVDPIAYERSSPLEFASGLKDSLLICHGVIDDNVLFEDSMRLYERLIELHKDDFTMSPYPLDNHGFTNADSWLDEYKRIYRLFEAHLSH